MEYTVIKTKDLKAEYPNNKGIFFPYNILTYKDGKQYDFSIETRDLNGNQDCKISNFGINLYMRPKQALKDNFMGYKSIGQFSKAVKNCLINHGFDVIGWIER